ncbi:MAG TPA: hypothetical protein VGR62_16735 [Candidatus Binatia bacterium]|nr:hypothetical protein [Candidatus Binatia bacterium]
MLWLVATPADDDLVAAHDALVRVAADLDRRLDGAGLHGVDDVLDAHRRLRAVIDGLASDDVARMTETVAAVRDWVETVAAQLERLRAIKARCPE